MSFQAYLDNIKARAGKSPEDFKKMAKKKGLIRPDVKAGEIVAWLKKISDWDRDMPWPYTKLFALQ